MEMQNRKAQETDIQSIVNLLNDCKPFVLPHHDYVYWILGNFYQSTTYVCVESERLIGFICGLPSIDQSTIFIWQVCVHPEFRRKGVALYLIKLLFDTSVKLGFNNLQLSITAENSFSKSMFKKFSDLNSLKMEFIKQSIVSDNIEYIYKISKIKIYRDRDTHH
jgi:L-2,4-diaminobutyric acid acetyltransferase